VVVAATDPNPAHAGRGFDLLRQAGIQVDTGLLADESARLNEVFNHWIIHRTPFVTVKAAMTLDGKIATASGDSKWITGEQARAEGQRLRLASDAILVGINTVLADDPSLTVRLPAARRRPFPLRRIILDSRARTPLNARVVTDDLAAATTIVVTRAAPKRRVAALARRVRVLVAPAKGGHVDLRWLVRKLGKEGISSLLVEGGGEVNSAFLFGGLVQRVAFFYAPKILGGRDSRKGVAGPGARGWGDILKLGSPTWRKLGDDLLLTARVIPTASAK
jgi:diaminohydroxyphosphoribosylaminopyrimidine deaminase/5-amino-6-(5-phosphoribosylamino)uracil reductase